MRFALAVILAPFNKQSTRYPPPAPTLIRTWGVHYCFYVFVTFHYLTVVPEVLSLFGLKCCLNMPAAKAKLNNGVWQFTDKSHCSLHIPKLSNTCFIWYPTLKLLGFESMHPLHQMLPLCESLQRLIDAHKVLTSSDCDTQCLTSSDWLVSQKPFEVIISFQCCSCCSMSLCHERLWQHLST